MSLRSDGAFLQATTYHNPEDSFFIVTAVRTPSLTLYVLKNEVHIIVNDLYKHC